MSNTVVLKRSAVSGKTPTTGDLALGELALNTYDGNLFFKKDSGTPTIMSVATLTGSQTLTNKTLTSPALTTPSVTGLATFTTTTAANAVNITYTPSATTGYALTLTGKDSLGGTGYFDFFKVTNTTSGATNPNKSFRLNNTGNLEIINSAYSTVIFSLSDGGQLVIPSLNINGGSITAGGSTGTSGQILASTGTGVQWITSSAGGGGSGTVTSIIAGTGLSGGTITTSGTIALATGYGDTLNPYASKTANYVLAAPNDSAGVPVFRALVAADIPTLNQNTTGNAATATTLATGRTISLTGDVAYTSGAFDGSSNVTGTATLASVGTAGTYTKVTTDAKGRVTSGTTLVATDIPALDAAKITTGTIDAARLPSYVDDVLEGANLAAFPATGETGKIYVALDTNKTYRWSGSAYVYITSGAVDSVAGKTGVVTLVKADVGLGSVDNTADSAKSVASAATLTTARTINGVSFNGSAAITVTANTTNALTIGTGLSGTSFNGSGAVTIAIDSTVATLTGTQTLTNKTISSGILTGTLTAGGSVGTNGQVLKSTATGVQWGDATATSTLDGLTDVVITSPTSSQVLAFNGSQWVNADPGGTVASAVFAANAQTDLGSVTDLTVTITENLGSIATVADLFYDMGQLKIDGIVSLNNIDQSVRSDYIGYSIIFGF